MIETTTQSIYQPFDPNFLPGVSKFVVPISKKNSPHLKFGFFEGLTAGS